jgi:hypothetical protein
MANFIKQFCHVCGRFTKFVFVRDEKLDEVYQCEMCHIMIRVRVR